MCYFTQNTFLGFTILNFMGPLTPRCHYLLSVFPFIFHVFLFANWLILHLSAYSTSLHLSAISYAHKLGGFCDPTKSFLIQKLLTALSRQRCADIRLPITRPVLHELVRSLEYTNSSAFQRTLFLAMFLTAFYGLFRIGELSTKSTRFTCSVVQYCDLQILLRGRPVHGQDHYH